VDVFVSKYNGSLRVIAVRGEIDVAAAEDLFLEVTALADPVGGPVLLDLSRVTFMDCAGFEAVCAVNRQLRAAGGSVRITAVSPSVARLFQLVGAAGRTPYGLAWPAAARQVRCFAAGEDTHRARERDVQSSILCAGAHAIAGHGTGGRRFVRRHPGL
jgi:anti-anti-sigma factor